jgi:hypothetical protein
MSIFWGVVPCSLVMTVIMALMMESVSPSEASVNFYQNIRHNIPEDSHLHHYWEYKPVSLCPMLKGEYLKCSLQVYCTST